MRYYNFVVHADHDACIILGVVKLSSSDRSSPPPLPKRPISKRKGIKGIEGIIALIQNFFELRILLQFFIDQ